LGPKQLNQEAVRRELNDIEAEAMQRFKKNDEEIVIEAPYFLSSIFKG